MKGKRAFLQATWHFLLSALLALSLLAGCSAREEAKAPSEAASSEPQPPSSSVQEKVSSSVPASSEAAAPKEPEEVLHPGKILALDDAQRPDFPDTAPVLAAQAELKRWEELLFSREISRLDAGGMNENEKELSPEEAKAILDILKAASLSLYEALENPPTGGTEAVYAYAADGSRLFFASYNGAWLSVQFSEENAWYIFNAENSGLEQLAEYIG